MKVYTKNGDQAWTSLLNHSRVSKTDDRIEFVGTADELNAHLGLVKAAAPQDMKEELSRIQCTLMRIMSGVVSFTGEFKVSEAEVLVLEERIDSMEAAMSRPPHFVLYGGCELSARLDVARAVARRAERQLCRVAKYHSVDAQAMKYLNRLSDYLYICARKEDFVNGV